LYILDALLEKPRVPLCSQVASPCKRVHQVDQDYGQYAPLVRLVRSVEGSVAMVLARPGARLLSDGFREALPALIHFSTAAT
jgi:hypothetical protein